MCRIITCSSFLISTLAAVVAVGHAQATPADQRALAARLAALMDSLEQRGEFSGVVTLAHDGTVVFQRAAGYADRAEKRPNRHDTAFNLASVNKLFTATAISQLASAGRIDLDAPLVRAWPDYPNQDVARRVTVRQLLTMRSGVDGNIFGAPPGRTRHDLRHNRDFLSLFVEQPLAFEPGTKQQYSNAGFVVLGALVQRVSGEDYYAYVRQHVFEPTGMTHSGSWPIDSLPPNTAIGYTRQIDGGGSVSAAAKPNSDMLPGRGSAAGGGYSTADDLLRYLEAVRAGRLPSMFHGWVGGSPGANVVVDGALPGGYQLIVLANLDPPIAQDIAARVREWIAK
jgi:CubicO group peptidase (beta-lactamase class C family)